MKRRDLLQSAMVAGADLFTNRLGASVSHAAMPARQPSPPTLDDYETFPLGDFSLISGEALRSATLTYKTHGELSRGTPAATRACTRRVRRPK